jgi:hypothetical protein
LPIHDVFAFNAVSALAVQLTDPAANPATHGNTASQLLNVKRRKVGPPVNAAFGHERAQIQSQVRWRAMPPRAAQATRRYEKESVDTMRAPCAAVCEPALARTKDHGPKTTLALPARRVRLVCSPRAVPDRPLRTAHITRKKRRDENRK